MAEMSPPSLTNLNAELLKEKRYSSEEIPEGQPRGWHQPEQKIPKGPEIRVATLAYLVIVRNGNT